MRISSLTREPPSLGMFLITILPWILVYKPKTKVLFSYYFPIGAILFLSFFSGSRSGMMIILLQFLIYVFYHYTHRISIKKLVRFLNVGILSLFLIPITFLLVKDLDSVKKKIESYNFYSGYNASVSNKTRLGTYVGFLETISENTILGVGYGQSGFNVMRNYPEWAKKDNPELKRYMAGEKFPPSFNLYFRILVESGFLGLLIFLFFLNVLFFRSSYWFYKSKGNELKNHSLVLVLSIVGFSFTWIQFDTFRVLGFWLFFAYYLYIQRVISYQNG